MLILIAVGGYATYRYYNGRIKHIAIAVPSSHPQPTEAPPGTENYLLVGVDSRAGTGNEYQSQGAVDGERSDTTILAHLDKDGTTTLLSFPRDMYVKIPSYKDCNGVQHDASMNKFNYAIQAGGPSLLVDMVQQLTGIKVDHYVQIDLEGFKKMSSAIGGVQVCLKASSYEYYGTTARSAPTCNDGFSQFHGTVGPNTLEGDNALAFVRERYGLPNGDIDRIKRQQVFLGAVFRKATSTNTLLNPEKLFPLLNAATGALEMDKGTGLSDLRKLASRLRGLDPNKIVFETVKTRNADLSDPGAFLDPEQHRRSRQRRRRPDVERRRPAGPRRDPSAVRCRAPRRPLPLLPGRREAPRRRRLLRRRPRRRRQPRRRRGRPAVRLLRPTPTPETAADAGTCANPIY